MRRGNPNFGHTSKERRTNGDNSRLTDALFNDIEPGLVLQREKPVHRLIVELAQRGGTVQAIAAEVGMTQQHVSQVLRQPWARQRIVNGLKESIQNELKELLERSARPALERIVTLSESAEDLRVKADANKYLVDRLLGKPSQPVEDRTVEPNKLSDDELNRRVTGIVGESVPETDDP